MKRLLFLCLCLLMGLPVASAAPEWLEVSDGGQYVVVLAKGVQYKSYKVKTSKQYLLIELDGVTLKKERVPVSDKTVSKLETVGGQSSSRLYIEIKKDAPTPLQLVPLVRVETVAEGLRVMIPRSIEAAVAPVVAAPTLSPVPLPEALLPKPAPTTQAAPIASPSQEKKEQALPPIIIQNSGGNVSVWFLAVLLLAGLGAVVWLKKKQVNSPDEARIKVTASHSLDGKNKLVLVTAGKKELLLSVSEGGTRLIERWKKEEPERSYESELQEAQANEFHFESPERVEFAKTVRPEQPKAKISNEYWHMDNIPKPGGLRSVPKPQPEAAPAAPTAPAPKGDDAPSAAVAGILRLRKKQSSEEQQDDEWTRELLAMAGNNKLSS